MTENSSLLAWRAAGNPDRPRGILRKTVGMETRLQVEILPQPDDFSCGPTCLHALYRYYGEEISLDRIVAEVPMLESGGTLDVLLANHALARGYSAKVFTYNVQMFDP